MWKVRITSNNGNEVDGDKIEKVEIVVEELYKLWEVIDDLQPITGLIEMHIFKDS